MVHSFPVRHARARCLFLLAAISALAARADVHLPAIFGDHMVVQRGMPVHVWGMSDPHESVQASFHGQQRSTTADDTGRWNIYFAPVAPGGPFELSIQAHNQVSFSDILVGDVWVASGQSNMEFPTKGVDNAATELSGANQPHIRLWRAEHRVSNYPLGDIAAKHWVACMSETVRDFSAVAYFFGRNLQSDLKVPVGLVETSWGGTPAEAWTSLPALTADSGLMPIFAEWAEMMQQQSIPNPERDQKLAQWRVAADRAKAEGREIPSKPYYSNDSNSWQPAGLFNAMIAPLTPFAIRGVIWYQGESNANAERAPHYARLFQAMIRDWRNQWGEGDFPFLFVQLANFIAGQDGSWPIVRDAQRQALSLANTGMAVTIDIGNPHDIHPKDKQDVGTRLALAARAIAYGEQVECSGPRFRQADPEDNAIRVWFDHADGLHGRTANVSGFEVAGEDHQFQQAGASVDGTSVVVSSPSVPAPKYVRYGWADNPGCDLVNSAALPASPFTSM